MKHYSTSILLILQKDLHITFKTFNQVLTSVFSFNKSMRISHVRISLISCHPAAFTIVQPVLVL